MGTDDWSWRISGIVCKWPVILCDGSERRRGRERVGEEWRDEICRTDEKKGGRRRKREKGRGKEEEKEGKKEKKEGKERKKRKREGELVVFGWTIVALWEQQIIMEYKAICIKV